MQVSGLLSQDPKEAQNPSVQTGVRQVVGVSKPVSTAHVLGLHKPVIYYKLKREKKLILAPVKVPIVPGE